LIGPHAFPTDFKVPSVPYTQGTKGIAFPDYAIHSFIHLDDWGSLATQKGPDSTPIERPLGVKRKQESKHLRRKEYIYIYDSLSLKLDAC
jgi:hypothetical protein